MIDFTEGLKPNVEGLLPTCRDVQPNSNSLQPKAIDVQPNIKGLQPKVIDVQPNHHQPNQVYKFLSRVILIYEVNPTLGG